MRTQLPPTKKSSRDLSISLHSRLDIHAIIQLDTHTPMNTLNLTDGQLDYLQQLVMFGYEMEVPEQKGWDIQTYDNLVDEVMK